LTRAHRHWGRSALVLAAFSFGWAALLVVIGVVSVAGPLWALVEQGVPVTELGERFQALIEGPEGVSVTATTLAIQFPLMLALAEGVRRMTWWVVWEQAPPVAPMREGYAWHGWGGWKVIAVAVVAGATTGWAPGWVAGRLREAFPAFDLGGVAMVNEALSAGTTGQVAAVVGAVVVGAPVVEELVFRGMLWDAFSRTLAPWATWLVVSVVFSAYHMDPFQALPLLFTAGVIGWFRLRTASVLPGMVVHFVNNALGLGIAASGVVDAELPLWGVILSALVAVGACASLPMRTTAVA